MKKATIIFMLIMPAICGAQSISYSIEVPKADSILLIEQVVYPGAAENSAAKSVNYILFADTASLTAFVMRLDTTGGDRIAKGNALVAGGSLLKSQAAAIRAAMAAEFGGGFMPAPAAPAPATVQKQPATKPQTPKKPAKSN